MTRRWLIAVLALMATMLVALSFAAGITATSPWSPERVQRIAISEMQVSGSQVRAGPGDALWFEGADSAARSVLLAGGLQVQAEDWDILALDFAQFPAELRLLLVWRSSEEPNRLRTRPLPRPGRSIMRIDLSGSAEWSGTISELGVALFPATLIPANATRDRVFALRDLQLESSSVRGALAVLVGEWAAYRPWMGRSINTAGYELGNDQRYSLVWLVALAVVLSGLAWALLVCRTFSWLPLGIALVLGWLVLDLHQVAQLFWRSDFLRQAQLRDDDMQVDVALNAALVELRTHLAAADIRLALVGSTLPFHRTYGAFRLLPVPSAAIDSPPLSQAVDARVALVLIGAGEWRHDPQRGRLHWAEHEYPVELLYQDAQLAAFRIANGQNGGVPQ